MEKWKSGKSGELKEKEFSAGGWRRCWIWTCISVSIPKQFVQQVTELPADHGVAWQRQVEDVGPEGGSSTLLVTPHDNIFIVVKETPKYRCTGWTVVETAHDISYNSQSPSQFNIRLMSWEILFTLKSCKNTETSQQLLDGWMEPLKDQMLIIEIDRKTDTSCDYYNKHNHKNIHKNTCNIWQKFIYLHLLFPLSGKIFPLSNTLIKYLQT